MSFTSDLQRFSGKTKIKLDTVVRKVFIDLMADLVRSTPRDTGMAKSNWFVGTNRVGSIDQNRNASGSPSLQRAAQFAQNLKAGGVFYITNNLPYILKLEFGGYRGPTAKVDGSGFSIQAPGGMARLAVDRAKRNVSAVVAGIR